MKQNNLVIVESPAKARTIEKILGADYKVMPSYGHVRDLKTKELSIDTETFEPVYEIPRDKKSVVKGLKDQMRKAHAVWLATDEDREGEAISWHLCEVLGLDKDSAGRIVFHEITSTAILEAVTHPRRLDMNLVNAQQARRVLDRLVGFKLSPVLWKKVRPALSAGRVQSVAVRIIVEREREIQSFHSETFYRLTAVFYPDNNEKTEIHAELNHRFKTHDEALAFLTRCASSRFTVLAVQKKQTSRSPAPPFTTSTLQQEAARKLGFTVSFTMRVAQILYEKGLITYMRTDSVNLASLAVGAAREVIREKYGEKYSKQRRYQTHTKGAQEAHEAIRPTDMSRLMAGDKPSQRKLYELIWKRTAACQMADALVEKTTAEIIMTDGKTGKKDGKYKFVATGETLSFDGFLKVYRESRDDNKEQREDERLLPPLKEGENLSCARIVSTQRFIQPPARYTEASLVKKMEEMGIGRPSTYAPTISTIQSREYVTKGEKKGVERTYETDTLENGKVSSETKTEITQGETGKLLPTDTGIVVNDFLMASFPYILDYNFTAKAEKDFDIIAEGKEEWKDMIRLFYSKFEPQVKKIMEKREEHKVGEREIGTDPKTGRAVYAKISRFGPVIQIGQAGDEEKPLFASLPKEMSIETITLEEALELFKLPRAVGEYEGKAVIIRSGRYGPYVQYGDRKNDVSFVSLPKEINPMTATLEECAALIREKKEKEEQRHIKRFSEDPGLEILKGPYGPYIAYKEKHYRIPKEKRDSAADMSYSDCMKIVKG